MWNIEDIAKGYFPILQLLGDCSRDGFLLPLVVSFLLALPPVAFFPFLVSQVLLSRAFLALRALPSRVPLSLARLLASSLAQPVLSRPFLQG